MKLLTTLACYLTLIVSFAGCGGGGFKYEDPHTRDGVSEDEIPADDDAGVVTDPAMMGGPN